MVQDRRSTMRLLVFIAFLAITNAEICRPTTQLQALNQSYKSHEDHILMGRFSACGRLDEELSVNVRYRLLNPVEGLVLQEETGVFEYIPPQHFSGAIQFNYTIEDDLGRSEPALVTIKVRGIADDPNLDVSDVIVGLEGDDILLDIRASLEDTDGSEKLTVALCSCAQDVTCNRYSGKCHCHLSMPDGWHIYNSNGHALSHKILANLGTTDLEDGLTLRPAPFSSGEHCLDIYAISQDRNDIDEEQNHHQTHIKRQMLIHVQPLHKEPLITHDNLHAPDNATQFYTEEGQPIQISRLSVKDNDGIDGTYRVRVTVDQGGNLWVRQDIRDDVVFFPKEQIVQGDESTLKHVKKEASRPELLDRDSVFTDNFQPHDTSLSNNGKKILEFMGSKDGVNEILSTLLFVPWCNQWPTPPNWNLPEDSWMVPDGWDQIASMDNDNRPVVWPQWYPRFWYPFPIKSWSWWPRVIPPYWLEHTCSDWTSRVHLEVQEITPPTCDVDTNHPKATWDAEVHVEARTSTPKSLITDNLFTYFPEHATSFLVKNIHIRSREEEGKLRFRLSVNSSIASVENLETRLPTFSCYSLTECNSLLRQIKVDFYQTVKGVCHVPVEIFMYKDDSTRLADYLMVWGVKSTDECVNVRSTHPEFEMAPEQETTYARQGETVPLSIASNVDEREMKGILHTTVQAQDGLVTVEVPDGLRVYLDHMGQHSDLVTYFCMSGPAYDVIKALKTAKFTPLKNFKGFTKVTVEYGMTMRSLQLTYGIPTDSPIPKQSFTAKVKVLNGNRPYFPVLSMPEKVCTTEGESLLLDQIRLERRYTEDEIVSMSLYSEKGSLSTNEAANALYACPVAVDLPIQAGCQTADACVTDDSCPQGQHCCAVATGCGRQCIEPEEVGVVMSYNPRNVVMHGKISIINKVFADMDVSYMPRQCQIDGQGGQDRNLGWEMDTIRISVIPSRNPEGDSVINILKVNVTCNPATQLPLLAEVAENQQQECTTMWGAWSSCVTVDEEEACGIGMQERIRQCESEHRQTRPCLKCDCEVQNRIVSDVNSLMHTCTSLRTISTCPESCEAQKSHYELVDFSCTDARGQQVTTDTRNVRVHESCSCRSCSDYHVDSSGRLINRDNVNL